MCRVCAVRTIGIGLLLAGAWACNEAPPARAPGPAPAEAPPDERTFERANERESMVVRQIEARGVRDERVLAALRAVPRHLFVPPDVRRMAYEDHPLPIGYEQTISQPYIVAYMTEMLALAPGERVLEIGTGSGYQAAVLAELGCQVYSIEIVAPLAERAAETLRDAGYADVEVRAGDGYRGWPEHAPFDAVIVTAAPDHIPEPLVEQLAEGGRLILPVGDAYQELKLLRREGGGVVSETLIPVRFVPMTGEARGEARGEAQGEAQGEH